MHFGLVAGIAQAEPLEGEDLLIELPDDFEEASMHLPPDFTLIGRDCQG